MDETRQWIEEQLTDVGLRYQLGEVLLENWDEEASLLNQARTLDTYNEVFVERYRVTLAHEGTAAFPPVVVTPLREKFRSESGNHRLKAAQLEGVASFPAYILQEPGEGQLADLRFRLNRRIGFALSRDELRGEALRLVGLGYTLRRASKATGVPEGTLQTLLARDRAQMRLSQLGVRVDSLAPETLRQIDRVDSDDVARALGLLVASMRMPQPEVKAIVTELQNRKHSEIEQLAYITDLASLLQARVRQTVNGRLPEPPGIVSLRRAFRSLALVEVERLPLQRLDPGIVEEFRSYIDPIRNNLDAFERALDADLTLG